MDLMNALAGAGGVEAISRELGIDQATAQSGMSALLPAVADGMRGQAVLNWGRPDEVPCKVMQE